MSEVATNAVQHARGETVRVRVLDHGLRLRVEVSDEDTTLPVARDAAAHAENGRGLALVTSLAVGFGVVVDGRGKTTWFEVGL